MITEKYKIKERIDWLVKNKVNSISPTISPAPKNKVENEVESPIKALQYYFDRGVRDFIVQKKYMGSYCDIYLTADINDTYFISRNGFRINHIDTEEAITSCKDLHSKFNWDLYSTIIIQSEMLPWAALGQTLITNDFYAYANAHETHNAYLKSVNLYEKIEQVRRSSKYQEYKSILETHKTVIPNKVIDQHVIRQYKSIDDLKILNLEEYSKNIELYQRQINHYGKQAPIQFKAFNVLKKIRHDGEEELVNDNYSYTSVNDDTCMIFTITNEAELETQNQNISIWFESLTNNMEEGIMIKPREAFGDNLPPCFKVRNNNYLTMIYGVHFLDEYKRYLKKRSITKKLENSINQWMLNKALLKIKNSDINDDNFYYKNLMYERIIGESKMKSIDHRL